jgi:chemotaxis protein CheC
MLSEAEMIAWAGTVNKGVVHAVAGLSQMVGEEIRPTTLKSGHISLNDVASLLGGPEALTVVVYLGFNGSATGHIVFAYQPRTAFGLIDMLMGQPAGSTQSLGEMEKSALMEMGNLVGAYFLNSLADANGLRLCPTPPEVMIGEAGVIIDEALDQVVPRPDDGLIVDATFGTQDQQISGTFLVLPCPDLVTVLRERWNTQ